MVRYLVLALSEMIWGMEVLRLQPLSRLEEVIDGIERCNSQLSMNYAILYEIKSVECL